MALPRGASIVPLEVFPWFFPHCDAGMAADVLRRQQPGSALVRQDPHHDDFVLCYRYYHDVCSQWPRIDLEAVTEVAFLAAASSLDTHGATVLLQVPTVVDHQHQHGSFDP